MEADKCATKNTAPYARQDGISPKGGGNGMAARNAMEAARLIGWCRNVGDACVRRYASALFRASIMEDLQKEKLLKACDPVYGWRLTRKGYRMLQESGIPLRPDAHTQRVGRRFEHAEIVVTMYAAGIDPYLTATEELRCRDGYLPAFALRARRGQQLLGNHQMAGLLRLQDTVYAVYYVTPGMDRAVNPARETDFLQGIRTGIGCTHGALLFCGADYMAIHTALHEPARVISARSRCVPYSRFFRMAQEPCLYLPCSAQGVRQLRILQHADYRARMCRALWGTDRYGGNELCADWIDPKSHTAFLLMADMDIRRIEESAYQIRRKGYQRLVLAGFQEQNRFLKQYYRPPFYSSATLSPDILDRMKDGDRHAPPV